MAVVPWGVTGGAYVPTATSSPPLFLDVEYYLERQIGSALHRLFMLVRGPNEQGYVDVRKWIAEGRRLKRRRHGARSGIEVYRV